MGSGYDLLQLLCKTERTTPKNQTNIITNNFNIWLQD